MLKKAAIPPLLVALAVLSALSAKRIHSEEAYQPQWKDPALWDSDGMWKVSKSGVGLKFLKNKKPAHNSMCWLKLKNHLKRGQSVQVTFRMEVPYKHIDLCMGRDSYQPDYGAGLPRFEEILTLGNRPETDWVTLKRTITSSEPVNTLAFLCWGWGQDCGTWMEVKEIEILPPDEDPDWFEWRVRAHLNDKEIPKRAALQDWFPFGVYISLGSMHAVAKREGKEGLWDLMDTVFADCKKAGMNMIWFVNTSTGNLDELAGLCKKYEIKMNPQPGQFNVKFAPVKNILREMKRYIPKYADTDIIGGWGAGEEFPVGKVHRLKKVHELVQELDPGNALVTIHNRTQCYEAAGKTLDIKMACRDIYPFFGFVNVGPTTFETSMNYYEDTIDKNQRWLPKGASLWVMAQGQGERGPRGVGGYIRTPSVEEVRVQAWSALSRCAKGLGYFVYHSSGTCERMGFDALRALDGSHTPRMKELSRLAGKILPHGRIITKWRSSRVVAETNNRRVRAYLFRGPENEAYAVVYNRTVQYFSHSDVRVPFETGATVTALPKLSSAKNTGTNDSVNEKAENILATSGVEGGLIVHVGCKNGRLTAALRAGERYVVQGLVRNREDLEAARSYIHSKGEYGPVSVRLWDGKRLPYAENIIKLLVSEGSICLPEKEILRVLTPRGVACFKKDGKWQKQVKPWPSCIDEWTHCWHGPDGNPVARDSKVGPPRHIQWMAGPRWQRHHDTVPSTTAMVSSSGRLFYIADLAPACLAGKQFDKWFLVARDAFSGILLWKRPMEEWGWKAWSNTWLGRGNQPYEIAKRLVAAGNRVYVTLSFDAPVTALDAATGEKLKTYKGTEGADEILYFKGRLILAVKNRPGKPGRNEELVHEHVCAVDAETGEILWKRGDYIGLHANASSGDGIKCLKPFGRLELTAGEDHVFLMDTDAIIALSMESGKKVWEKPRPEVPREWVMHWSTRSKDTCRLAYADGTLLLAQPGIDVFNPYDTIPGTLYAYSAETGKLMWKRLYGDWSHVDYQPDLFIIDGMVWVHKHLADKSKPDYELLAVDLGSGEVKRRFSTRRAFNVGHHHRCYSNRSTTEYVLSSHRGVEFLELSSGKNWLNHWVRGTCLFGYVPCNGLLYAPPDPCRCFIETKLNGYYALSAEKEHNLKIPAANWDRPLERGPAFGKPLQKEFQEEGSWPTFRHDAGRSGAASTTIQNDLKKVWTVQLGSRLTSPTVRYGKLFVAIRDQHQVAALDAATGRRLWSFTADSEVDTPPTLYRGLALFGARDGWAYCVRAEDGRLVWRRRIAPQDRFVGAYGRMESAWPLHGSVLVVKGLAYVVAGRSSYLDGGIFACALKPEDGKVVKEKNIYSPGRKSGKQPYDEQCTFDIPGTLTDILVSRKGTVYMRNKKLFEEEGGNGTPVFSTAGMLDPSWFCRTKWSTAGVPGAELAAFDGFETYKIEAYAGSGKGTGRNNFFRPGTKGYKLSRVNLNRKKGGEGWARRLPVRGKAMTLTGDKLAVAGVPDAVPAGDPLAAFEGRKGGRLWIVSASNGELLQKIRLDAPPVWQGMAAANGSLYVAERGGTLLCLGSKK